MHAKMILQGNQKNNGGKAMTYEKSLIQKKIAKLEELDFTILVLKGFTVDIYEFISQRYKKIEPTNVFNSKNELVLNNLENECRNIVGNLFTLSKDLKHVMLFESLQLIDKLVNISIIPIKFIILTNNFLDYYPNITNTKLQEFDTLLNEDLGENIMEDNKAYEIYSHCITINRKQYIKYIENIEYNYENLKLHYLIELTDIENVEIHKEQVNETSRNVIRFNDEKTYNELKIRWLYSDNINITKFLIDSSVINNKEINLQIRTLIGFFNAINLEATFNSFSKEIELKPRNELLKYLEKYWNSNTFRDLQFYKDPDVGNDLISLSQGEIIETIVNECEKALKKDDDTRDIFLTAPTGAGKSLLFQLPAIYIAENYNSVTIVITPLIALMKDQVFSLVNKGYEKVVCLNSELSLIDREEEIKKIKEGITNIIYLSPELLLSYDINTFIGEREIGLMVIDEAHLVTTWGRDFRVDYWYLGTFIRKIRKYTKFRFPVLALTATAVYDPSGINDMVFETIDSLNMNNALKYIGKVRRDDIRFNIKRPKIVNSHEEFKIKLTGERINQFCDSEKKSIIYCPWTSQINSIKGQIDERYKNKVHVYYGKLDAFDKEEGYKRFKDGEALIMIATKAFGMGVDIDDIVNVYHHAPSGHLADYVQEIGRLARKKELTGNAIIDFTAKDLKYTKILFGLSSIKQFQVKMVLEKLNKIYKYKKSRNLLVSVNDFEFIFNYEKVDVEQKVKSTLLLLEKDLLSKYRYNVIIVRPKSLFTSGFLSIPSLNSDEFEKKYKNYLSFQKDNNKESKGVKVYDINLEKLWSDKFSDKSFPLIKKSFFEGELFEDEFCSYKPQIKISYLINDDINVIFDKLTKIFEQVEKCLNKQSGFFSKDDLIKELQNEMKGNKLIKRIAELILHLYSDPGINYNSVKTQLSTDYFLQLKRVEHENYYRLIKKSFNRVMSSMRSTFTELFINSKSTKKTIFIPIKTLKEHGKKYIRMAYTLETFDLGTYELKGGESPAIFIRISDPVKIDWLVKSNYENDILKNVKNRFETSSKIMEYFFSNDISDNERWDFIENYFLGASTEELLKEY